MNKNKKKLPNDSKLGNTVDVVVLNWNGKRFIDGFLRTFSKQTYPKELVTILFVDNGSSDDSVAYFESAVKGKDIKYKVVLNGDNYGYAKGNNLGMLKTTADYVLVCNNDLELDPKLIEELVKTASKYDSSATVPKLMYLNKPGYINNAGSSIDTTSGWPIRETGANEKDTGQYNKEREITAFCGACVLFSRNFLETVGMYDNRFFMYFEDGDLSWRGQKAGQKFFYSPKAIAHHHHTGSSKEGSPLFNHYVGRNRLLILQKNGSFSQIAKAWAATLKDHLVLRIKNIGLALTKRYPRRQAWNEFKASQKMIFATIVLIPYATCKRIGIIKEETL